MNASRRLSFLSLFILLAASCKPGETAPATSEPAPTADAPAPHSIPFKRIRLENISPLYGGWELWLYSDGRLITHAIKPGPEITVRRFVTTVSPEDIASVQSLIDKHQFHRLKIVESAGFHDEASIRLSVVFSSQAAHVVEKWAHVENPDFDPIFAQLRDIANRSPMTTPVYEGAHNWKWTPDAP